MQRARIHHAVRTHAQVFLVVAGEMLEAGAHARPLYAADPCLSHFARQIRVFREILKIAPAERITLDVDPGAQHHLHILEGRFPADGLRHLAHQAGVERTGRKAGRREAGGFFTEHDAQIVLALLLFPKAVRAVAHRKRGDTQTL
ncbi:hypothetical protein SDC9_169779 [bioreactor metagenome]|uniref:Uncharacterized protein n=1 Tax=bioreactor metagenome TaxID=1076179 RepID=A0A645G8E1_9ZZZZ